MPIFLTERLSRVMLPSFKIDSLLSEILGEVRAIAIYAVKLS
jgi:hypothetical protein